MFLGGRRSLLHFCGELAGPLPDLVDPLCACSEFLVVLISRSGQPFGEILERRPTAHEFIDSLKAF